MTTPDNLPSWSDFNNYTTRNLVQILLGLYHSTNNKQDFVREGCQIMLNYCKPDPELLAIMWYAFDASHDR